MMLSELDGFLTGIAVGPEFTRPREWLPVVWGGEVPAFADLDETTAIVGAVLGRCSEILDEIADDAVAPVFWKDHDGAIIAADWAQGFMQAIKLRSDAWKPLFISRRGKRFLVPILWHCRDEHGRALLGLAGAADEQPMDGAIELIPDCVMDIATYWRRRRPGPIAMMPEAGFRGAPNHAGSKIGRNEPCPCGSGQKFKRCCGRAA